MQKILLPFATTFFFIVLSQFLYAQNISRKITLDNAMEIALTNSPDALNFRQQFKESYLEYRTFRDSYLPQLSLNGTLPDLERSISSYPLPDGSQVFVHQQYIDNQANLLLNQQIGFTGGFIYLSSGLHRLDNFLDSTTKTQYASNPINIGYSQPLFKYNPFKWQRKIEPLKYQQAKRIYLENQEQIKINTTTYFFNLLSAQIQKKITQVNLSNYDALFQIAKGRNEVGTIDENELYGFELSFLESQTAVEQAKLDLDNALFKFRSYLRIKDTIPLELIPPIVVDTFYVDPVQAIDLATKNSSRSLEFQKRLLEAASIVNQAKMDGRFDANLNAVFGFTQTAGTLKEAYKNPLDQQQVSLGFTIPILDWGVARGKIKIAQSKQEIEKNSVEQDIIDFQRDVYKQVAQFNMQKKQLRIAARSDTVAKKTYGITQARYMIGKSITLLQLNNDQTKADNAKLSFFTALQTYWASYFRLRQQTLFDFRTNKPIQFDFNSLK
ncbi:MAG: TolC family protein [Bacteroidetes bacterium]|nr:TolC family protein [Bacteroidota bacterium]